MAYEDDFLIDVDVQVDGFLHGEALRGECGLEVHILYRDLRQLQGHQCLKEFVTLEADEGGRQRGAWARGLEQYGKVVHALLDGGEPADGVDHHLAHARGEASVDEGYHACGRQHCLETLHNAGPQAGVLDEPAQPTAARVHRRHGCLWLLFT